MLSTFSLQNCFACSNYDGSTASEAADLHRKVTGNDADDGTLKITAWDRGATQ